MVSERPVGGSYALLADRGRIPCSRPPRPDWSQSLYGYKAAARTREIPKRPQSTSPPLRLGVEPHRTASTSSRKCLRRDSGLMFPETRHAGWEVLRSRAAYCWLRSVACATLGFPGRATGNEKFRSWARLGQAAVRQLQPGRPRFASCARTRHRQPATEMTKPARKPFAW